MGAIATSALDLGAVCAAASRTVASERDNATSARAGANATSAYDQGAARTVAVNELDVDGWRALIANRTLNLDAARAAATEPQAAVEAHMVRTAHGARGRDARRARCSLCAHHYDITVPQEIVFNVRPRRYRTPRRTR